MMFWSFKKIKMDVWDFFYKKRKWSLKFKFDLIFLKNFLVDKKVENVVLMMN